MSAERSLTRTFPLTVISAAANYVMDVQRSLDGISFQVNAAVNSTAKTAACGIVAVGTLGGVTYTAVKLTSGLDSAGNLISVAYTAGGTAGSEVVTVVGSAISVQIQSGVSTITQVRTAVNASAPAAALVTATGTSATTVATVAATLIPAMTTPTSGVDSTFSVANDSITISAHGYFTGQVVQATKSGAAFPTGIAAATNYFIFVVNANTIVLFDTLAHALAAGSNTAGNGSSSTGFVDITADGSGGSTITFTPTSISGVSYKLQWSNDYIPNAAVGGSPINAGNWIDAVSGETNSVITNNITVTANTAVSAKDCSYAYARILFAISAGTVQIQVIGHC